MGGILLLIACSQTKQQNETVSQVTQDVAEESSVQSINGHEFVDLGLSVKWATCNMGASTPSDFGDYYAWGEITPKSEYTTENSLLYEKQVGKIAGDSCYDAARANWGGTWRLPTEIEFEELSEKCERTWTEQNGCKGYLITGSNGNQIFLPAAGRLLDVSALHLQEHGYYWTALPREGLPQGAAALFFSTDDFGWQWCARNYGQSIRPVSD